MVGALRPTASVGGCGWCARSVTTGIGRLSNIAVQQSKCANVSIAEHACVFVTENIGRATLGERLDLVRVGKPLLPEFATWR